MRQAADLLHQIILILTFAVGNHVGEIIAGHQTLRSGYVGDGDCCSGFCAKQSRKKAPGKDRWRCHARCPVGQDRAVPDLRRRWQLTSAAERERLDHRGWKASWRL